MERRSFFGAVGGFVGMLFGYPATPPPEPPAEQSFVKVAAPSDDIPLNTWFKIVIRRGNAIIGKWPCWETEGGVFFMKDVQSIDYYAGKTSDLIGLYELSNSGTTVTKEPL